MVIHCKHCGAASKVDDARMPAGPFRIKCYQCQNILTIEPPKVGGVAARLGSSLPLEPPPRPSGRPITVTGSLRPPQWPTAVKEAPTAVIVAPEVESHPVTDRTHYLQKIDLLSALSYDECQVVESKLKPREFPPNHVVVREGGPGDSMFFIKAGLVEVRKKDSNTGIEFLLTELKAGSCFGEMSLLTGKPRAATVRTMEPTTCAVLESADFEELILHNPKVALALSRVLAERLEESNEQAGIEYVNLRRIQFDARVLSLLPQQMLLQHKIIPAGYSNNRLTLAMVNPNNLIALDDVRRIIKGVIIEPVVTSEDDFKRFMSTTYHEMLKKEEEEKKKAKDTAVALMKSTGGEKAAAEVAKLMAQSDTMEGILDSLQSEALKAIEVEDVQQVSENVTDLSKSAEDAPIIRMANNILALAIKKGASDIHVEPQENDVVVRFRIDGTLQQVQVLAKKVQMGLVSRLKILSKLDIAEKRLPQDGRISVRMEDRPIDFRVSTIPSKWGEKVCMRILDKSNTILGLDKLISDEVSLALVRDMIAQPYGIIYVTGPTGSGKTTTLYSALAELNDPDVNISTAEDPIEYDLPRINQVQAHKEIGLDFARILRAFLRQDPDIILVGETRDKETAHIAVEAALTGHLVFTTLHTNDAAGAFTRLGEMGVEPFLMSSSTIGIIAQRLTKRLCPHCKEPYTPDEMALKYMGLPANSGHTFYRQKGCDQCSFTGYKGRVGVYEVLRMNSALRKVVVAGGKSEEIAELAVHNGMKTLKDYSVWLLEKGMTTMEEVLQVVSVRE
ncbi:MAG: Flp pilus assembly complex ATPase component TadA [Acidobacteriia bacterium]|nr:Flp pilus assembly complex ATPase component TadA [Terriglobia bacterium]